MSELEHVYEGHKGGGVLFTVHEENKGPITVHEDNNAWCQCMKHVDDNTHNSLIYLTCHIKPKYYMDESSGHES